VQTNVKEPLNLEIAPAVLIKQLLWVTAASLSLSTLLFLLRGKFTLADLPLFVTVLTVLLCEVWLLRTNRILWAAHGFTAVFWLSLTLFMIVYGSFRVPNPGAYVFVIFLAAVLMQGRSVSIYLLLSILSGVLIIWGGEENYIPL
jgi:hypothetical protein